MEENKIISPIAVTISGFIIGRLFTLIIISFNILRFLDKPIEVSVPRIVAIMVASTAMDMDTHTAFMMSLLLNRFSYQRSEKLSNFVKDFDELKEYTIVTTIGR
jgi:hypothetical protein